jgi:putative tricarboxylic transport membrane protein
MRKGGFPLAPVILGLVLGPLMEKSLRRAMSLSGGEWSILFDSPIAITLWVLALASLVVPPFLARRTRLPLTTAAAEGETD